MGFDSSAGWDAWWEATSDRRVPLVLALGAIVRQVPEFQPEAKAHLDDYDEVLPYILIADFARFVETELETEPLDEDVLVRSFSVLEDLAGGGPAGGGPAGGGPGGAGPAGVEPADGGPDGGLDDLLGAGFLEALWKVRADARPWMGPKIRQMVDDMERWYAAQAKGGEPEGGPVMGEGPVPGDRRS